MAAACTLGLLMTQAQPRLVCLTLPPTRQHARGAAGLQQARQLSERRRCCRLQLTRTLDRLRALPCRAVPSQAAFTQLRCFGVQLFFALGEEGLRKASCCHTRAVHHNTALSYHSTTLPTSRFSCNPIHLSPAASCPTAAESAMTPLKWFQFSF